MESIKFPSPENLPSRESVLLKSLEDAKTSALPESDFEALKDSEDQLTRRFLAKEISHDEFDQEMSLLDKTSGVVECDTPEELEFLLLSLGLDEDTAYELVDHEQEHYDEAVSQGLSPLCMIRLYKSPAGGLGLIPSVIYLAPETVSDEEFRAGLSNTIRAASELSPRDSNQLPE